MNAKTIIRVDHAPPKHWVGNGFHVHNMFSYNTDAALYSPFLLLDYGSPTYFTPNTGKPRGVGAHPHRGFETVTIAYAGEIAHRDSSGGGGIIGEGDVQWMTAGAGIMHDEFHSAAFSQRGGNMHMVQLWVNLPAKDKLTPAHYQAIGSNNIPKVNTLAGSVRVIAGDYVESTNQTTSPHSGAATTYTPMHVWDVSIKAGHALSLPQPEGWTTLLLVQSGSIQANGSGNMGPAQLLVFSRAGRDLSITASVDSQCLLLAGEPIDEPVVGYGPFVMNTESEIHQAYADFHAGKFGRMSA